MALFSKKKNVNYKLKKAWSENEQTVSVANPDIGWYSIHTYNPKEAFDRDELQWILIHEGPLALIHVDLGEFKDGPIDDNSLKNMCDYLEYYYSMGKDVILRPAYDHEGRAIDNEPFFYEIVITHIKQITEALADIDDPTYIWQGVLIGNWGEMHTSRFLGGSMLPGLMQALLENRKQEWYLAVRKPSVWRNYHGAGDIGGNALSDKMGLFDDAILGSETDMGTFGEDPSEIAGWDAPWAAKDELEFENELGRYVPNGGEVVYEPVYARTLKSNNIVDSLRKMHVSYLNMNHDPKMLDYWKKLTYSGDGAWRGKNLYDYIGAHMGYRYLLKAVNISADPDNDERICCELSIKNEGFAPIYRECYVRLVTKDKEGNRKEYLAEGDLRGISTGEEGKFVAYIPYEGPCKLYLEIRRIEKDAWISLLNQGAVMRDYYLGELCND